MDQCGATTIPIPGQQSLHLPNAHTQHPGGRLRRSPAGLDLGHDLNPLQVALAHLHPAQSVASAPAFKEGGDTLALQSYDIIAVLAHIW